MTQFFQKDGVIPVIQSLTAVFRIIANTQKIQVPHFFKQVLERRNTIGFPLVDVGVNLLFHKIPKRFSNHVVIFGEIDLIGTFNFTGHRALVSTSF